MRRFLVSALLALSLAAPAQAQDIKDYGALWSLKPEEIRTLVASPQVMATRTASGWDAYCRCPVILKPHEVPEIVKNAVIAIEDRRFRQHDGIDWISLPSILTSRMRRGASTIPMQLAKNLLFHDLRQADGKTERKLLEFRAAPALDSALTKDEMLAAYLNQVEFGGREVVGLYRAARHHFGKEPRDLNLFEAALIAGMLKAPARYNPSDPKTVKNAEKRAKLVLRTMVDQSFITEAERKKAEATGVRRGGMAEFKIQAQAFAEWVVQTWGPGYVREGETVRLFVTLEPRYQRAAETRLAEMVEKGAVPASYNAAAVIMSPEGEVRAMVGSVDWAESQFNGAVKAKVQAGSTAKLALAAAACEAGKGSETRAVDKPLRRRDGRPWPHHGGLQYKGATTLKDVIAWSRNAGAVQLTEAIGVKAVAAKSRELGLDPGAKPESDLVLGPFSTNVLEVTTAYAAVANAGLRPEPAGVLAAVDGRGGLRSPFLRNPGRRALAPRCVAPVEAMLEEVVRSGTGTQARLGRWRAFGKTGTTTDNVDAWFVGASDGRVMGIWMGRPRTAGGPAIGGKDAPAQLFRQVLTTINGMEDWRATQESKTEPVVATGPAGGASSHPKRPSKPPATAQAKKPPKRTALPPPRPKARDGAAGA